MTGSNDSPIALPEAKPASVQVATVNAIQNAAQNGETGHLLEMATGTGKTTVAAAVIYLYISAGNAERVMFLVDRIELKRQAANDLRAALDNQYTVGIYAGQDDYDCLCRQPA